LVAGLFLLVMFTEGAVFGANLPDRPVAVNDGLIHPSLSAWQVAGIMGWHLLLLCTLLSATMIRYDGHDVPARLFFPGLAAGLVGSLLWPHLHPQPAALLSAGPTPGVIDGLIGLAAGAALGLAAWKLLEPSQRPDLVWSAALLGTLLGWQASVVLLPATAVCALLSKLIDRIVRVVGTCSVSGAVDHESKQRNAGNTGAVCALWSSWYRVPAVAWLGLAATVWIVQWKRLAELIFGTATGG
jgi:hypothetical protein